MLSATDVVADTMLHIPTKHRFVEGMRQKVTFFGNSNKSNFAKRSGFHNSQFGALNYHCIYKLSNQAIAWNTDGPKSGKNETFWKNRPFCKACSPPAQNEPYFSHTSPTWSQGRTTKILWTIQFFDILLLVREIGFQKWAISQTSKKPSSGQTYSPPINKISAISLKFNRTAPGSLIRQTAAQIFEFSICFSVEEKWDFEVKIVSSGRDFCFGSSREHSVILEAEFANR